MHSIVQPCIILCDSIYCSLPVSSVNGIFQAKILAWVAMPSSRGSSQPRDPTMSPTLQLNSLPSEPPGKTRYIHQELSGFYFLMWTIFKVFNEFVIILLLFYVLAFWLPGIWDLSSPTRDQICTLYLGRQSLNHWLASEVPQWLS